MEACELVRLIVNKPVVPAEPKRPGNPRLRTPQSHQNPRLRQTQRTPKRHPHILAPQKAPSRRSKVWVTHNTQQNNHWKMVETLPPRSRSHFQEDRQHRPSARAHYTSHRRLNAAIRPLRLGSQMRLHMQRSLQRL